MAQFGYTLSGEEHTPRDLVRLAARAEEEGFDFLTISDHFHPWVSAQGHAPFVWSVLGSIAEATEQIPVGVGVTCPTVRIHPAVIAQAAATTSLLLEDRFFLGVGTGELLNEHILGDRWPPPEIRLDMLEEAVEVMRRLWSGDTVDHHGRHYQVENARLFDPPAYPIPVIVSALGSRAAEVTARIGDGLWASHPAPEPVKLFEQAGGSGPRYGQVHMCWAPDVASARRTVHSVWPNAGITGQLSQDLPTWTHFEQAAKMVSEDEATKSAPCGPETDGVVKAVQTYVDAGFDHVHLHQIGADQDGFFRFWREELADALRTSFHGPLS